MKAIKIDSRKYRVCLASNYPEVEQALRLRFEVFNLELGEGLESSYQSGLDEDKYDQYCDHLLVFDNESNRVIGTYRLQESKTAQSGAGFYTSNEFDLESLPSDILSNAVELGRACIHPEHRNGRVLYLLWRGLAAYLMNTGNRYLFGCCSITSQDSRLAYGTYHYLKRNHHLHQVYNIGVKEEYRCTLNGGKAVPENEIELPQLFRLYLDVGTKVCSLPAKDTNFRTIDFLMLLDVDNLTEQIRTLFFK